MALLFQRDEIGFEHTGQTVTIPDNDVARLMYYLDCVCTAVEYEQDSDIRRFTNYNNWYYLSLDEQKFLVDLCGKYNPEILDNKVFFHSDILCGNSSNDFLKISEVRHRFLAVESIVIAGQTREVNKVMVYKMDWMRRFYRGPMERLRARFNAPVVPYRPALPHTPLIIPQPYVPQQSNRNKWICGIVIGIIILIIIGNLFGRVLQ